MMDKLTGVDTKIGQMDPDAKKIYYQAVADKEKIKYSGFIAQEVESAANATGYNFSGLSKPQNDKSIYGLAYSEFVVPLVKSVQEQQNMISEQQALIEKLNARIDQMQKELNTLKAK